MVLICSHLKAQSDAQLDTLTSEQASSLVASLNLGPVYTILQEQSKGALSSIPGMEPAGLKNFLVCIHCFLTFSISSCHKLLPVYYINKIEKVELKWKVDMYYNLLYFSVEFYHHIYSHSVTYAVVTFHNIQGKLNFPHVSSVVVVVVVSLLIIP